VSLARVWLLSALLLLTLVCAGYAWQIVLRKHGGFGWPRPVELLIGFGTNFFDTLGISSFASTAAAFRLTGVVSDRDLPGTLNVGHALPTVLQATIFIAAIDIESTTLVSMIAASMLGAYLGAAWVSSWSVRAVRVVLGAGLLCAAGMLFAQQCGLLPGGGVALGLADGRLALAVGCNFLLGVLMMMGIGLYAPCMILVALLGMDPKAAFPIMMGSCAFLMLSSTPRFLQGSSVAVRPALGLALGGLPGVWIAANVVRSLPVYALRWLVFGVVIYTGTSLLAAARRSA